MDSSKSTRRRILYVIWLTFQVTLLSVLWWSSQASAHAVLLEHYPLENASLTSAPDQVRLRFDEVVLPVLVRVLDASGQPVTGPGDVSEIDETVVIRLPQNLPSGSYIVSYRVISADSHPVGGSFVFSVGPATTDPKLNASLLGAAEVPAWTTIATALRALFYVACLFGTGGGLFLVFVDRHSSAAQIDRRQIIWACVIAGIVLTVSLGIEGGSAAAAPLAEIFDPAIWRIGIHTTLGESAIVIILGLAILVFGASRRGGPVASLFMLKGIFIVIIGFALTGHVATAEPRWLTIPMLTLHVLCDTFWVGALVPLYRRLGIESGKVAAPIVARFSRQALFVVPVLFASGLLIAAVQVRTPSALIETAYGQRLLAKLILVAALLMLAALNKLRLTPALERGAIGAARPLRKSIFAEFLLILGILAITATIGEQIPPRALAAKEAHENHHMEMAHEGFAATITTDNQTALLDVTPAHTGDNRLTVTLTKGDRTPLTPLELSIRLSNPALGVEPSDYKATNVAPGRYVVAAQIPIAGNWTLEIDALVSDFERKVFTTTLPIR